MATRIGSLCTGIGALDDAVATVTGASLAWVADPDPNAASILANRHPHAANLGDITTASWGDAEPVDILTAGVPCQPVSKAGKRAGVTDARWLWPHAARAVRELRPRLVVLENVAAWRTRGLGHVLTDLAALGYDARWLCLRASEVGAPHQRDHMFVAAAAHPDGEPWHERWQSTAGKTPQWWPRPHARRPGRAPDADPSSLRRHQGQPATTRFQGRLDVALAGRAAWGEYAPAVARWEHLTRPAPAPTAPTGRASAHRLSPVFVEWLLGLDIGHVTEVDGISRNAMFRLLGNTVVPAQAEAAVRLLLDNSHWPHTHLLRRN